jgi:hypothetical protein
VAERIAELNKQATKAKYPWDEWTDGSVWVAYAGQDYNCSDQSFRQGLHVHRRNMTDQGYNVRLETAVPTEGQVQFQFIYE